MLPRLLVSMNSDGMPICQVDGSHMWDLVEYLSCQRVAVTYRYEASHFTVTFTHVDGTTAQRILDGWCSLITPERRVA